MIDIPAHGVRQKRSLLVRVIMLQIFMLAILLVVPSVYVVILELIKSMFGIEKPQTYIVKVKQFPTIAQTKYDFARSIAADVVSSQMIRCSRMLVASREWNEEKWEGSRVVEGHCRRDPGRELEQLRSGQTQGQ